MRRQVIEETVTAYFKGFESRDPDTWMATLAEECIIQDPAWGELQGRVEQERWFLSVVQLFDSIRVRQDSLDIAGGRAIAHFTATCRSHDGREINHNGMDVFEINQMGFITRLLPSWDSAKTLAEIAGIRG